MPACPPSSPSRIASLDAHNAALDIVELATKSRRAWSDVARVYFEVGARIGLDWLREQVEQLAVDGPWQAVARTGLRDSALRIHRRLAERVLARDERGTAAGARRQPGWNPPAKSSPTGSARSPTCAPPAPPTSPRSPSAWRPCASSRIDGSISADDPTRGSAQRPAIDGSRLWSIR